MDREIPKEVRQKERNKKIIRYSSIGVESIVVIVISCTSGNTDDVVRKK